MRYEPVGYIYELEIGALAVFLIVLMRYFSTRRFPNQKNRLFSLIMCMTVINVILDIFSSIIIDNIFQVPLVVTYIVNPLYYSTLTLMLLLMLMFAFSLTGYISKKRFMILIPTFIPGIILLILLASSPLTHLLYYVDPVAGYVHAPLFGITFAASFIYLVLTFIHVLRNRKSLRKEEYYSVNLFLVVILCSTLIQFLFPQVLITGVAINIAVVLMYFTIQNPESMIDLTTGAFTYDAMLNFLHDRMQENDHVHIAAVKILNMSRINDLLGVDNGSLLLKQLFKFLAKDTEDTWIFRMRGSCFVAITRKEKDFTKIKMRLEEYIKKPWVVNDIEVLLHTGICFMESKDLGENPMSSEDTVNYIESALDECEKIKGRATYITIGQEYKEKIKRQKTIEKELREAFENGSGLELYFQPLWSVNQERFFSAEVLLRFKHSRLGMIPSDEFVSIAEKNGFISALDEFVIRETCLFLQEHDNLQEYGFESLEINISALEFVHKRLPDQLKKIMADYQVNPQLICLEVTETAATESFELLYDCMTDIIQHGCKFALDDFGTGYANISQVIQLPFSTVKLDKSMLYGSPIVLEDVIRMFNRINRKTIIEGVETAEQVELVKSFGVDVIQGFYYAKPMNHEDFCKLLESNRV